MFQSTLQQVANTHQEQHHTDEYSSRPHMCDTCGKRFTLLENLNRHQMIHTDERPYLCNYCQKRFRLAQHLKEHIRIHTGEKPYKCNECGRAFCQISNLKSHQKTHTKIKAFRCEVCGKSFRRSFTLKQHRLTHARHKVDVLKNPPPLLKKDVVANQEKLSRKRSAPASLGAYCSDRKMSQNCYPRESSNGLAILSAIGAQMSRFSPNNSINVQSSVSAYQPPQTAPLLSNNDKERYVFPSLTALLSHEDTQSSSSTPMQYNTALHSLTPESLNFYTQRYNNFLTQNTQQNASSTMQATERFCCNECNQTFDKEIDLQGHVTREHIKRMRRDSAYSSHDDKSLPNSPENKNNNFTVENAQRTIKEESHCSDDDVIRSDCDAVKEKSTKSGAKWKQQLCRGWLSHEEEGRHSSNEDKQKEREICDISPAPLMIESIEDAPITEKRNEVPSNQQPASLTENQSNVPSLISGNAPPPLCFGMERMVPVIEWKPVVTGWRDAMTGYVYPMAGTQVPSKYHVPSETPTASSAGQPYFNFSPNVLRACGMTAFQQQTEDVARANANMQSVLTPPSEENLEKYNNMLRQGLLQNWDPNRMRLFGTSSTPAEPNLLIAQ